MTCRQNDIVHIRNEFKPHVPPFPVGYFRLSRRRGSWDGLDDWCLVLDKSVPRTDFMN